VILANRIVMAAYETDVRPLLAQARVEMGRHPDPIVAFREGGYLRLIAEARTGEGLGALGG
jgi:L-rhamnose isomerase/sugar isomerase